MELQREFLSQLKPTMEKRLFFIKGEPKKVYELVKEMSDVGCVTGKRTEGNKVKGSEFMFPKSNVEFIQK